MLYKGFAWLLLGFLVNNIFNESAELDHFILVVYCFLSYLFCIYNWIKSGCRFTSVYILFVVYALFSNLGQSIIYILTNSNIPLIIYSSYTLHDICEMLRFQGLSIAGLNLGTLIYISNKRHCVSNNSLQNWFWGSQSKNYYDKYLFNIFLYFSLLSVYVFATKQIILRQTLSYNELTQLGGINMLPRFGSIVLGFISVFRKHNVKLVIVSWIFFFFAFMISGTRNVAIPYLGALFVTVPIINRNITNKKYLPIWCSLGFIGFALISVISSTRAVALGNGFSVDSLGLSFMATIQEMGSSARPLLETMRTSTVDYPQTFLYNTLLIFFPSSILDVITPADWQIHLGTWINTLHSDNNEWGFSFLAEAYLNFGRAGWVFMVFYGYLISLLENVSYRKILNDNYLFASCFLGILCRQIFFARAQFGLCIDFCRPAFYLFIIYILFFPHRKQPIFK